MENWSFQQFEKLFQCSDLKINQLIKTRAFRLEEFLVLLSIYFSKKTDISNENQIKKFSSFFGFIFQVQNRIQRRIRNRPKPISKTLKHKKIGNK